LLLLLLGQCSSKKPKALLFKIDSGEIWQDCSSHRLMESHEGRSKSFATQYGAQMTQAKF